MHRLVLLACVCLAVLPLPRAVAEEEAPSPFGDQALLEKLLGPACDMVEAVTGHTFEKRPTVRVSTAKEVGAILAVEFEDLPEEMLAADGRKAFANALAKLLMAKYAPATHTIHILPKTIEFVHKTQPKLPRMGEDHLRVLLAHEATHALDFPRYGFQALRGKLKAVDAHQALSAIVEGHAEFVAEEAAKRWKLAAAFERLETAIAGEDSTEGTAAERAMRAAGLSQVRFAYVQGHAFFTAVAKAQGVAGVEKALRNPPTDSRLIEKPALWLDPSKAGVEPDVAPIAESFRWLVGGAGWHVATQRVLEAALRTQAIRVPEARRSEWLQGFQNAHMLQGQHATGGARLIAMVLLFDTPEHAALFAELDRAVVDATKFPATMTIDTDEVSDGAGPAGRLPGFAMHRVVKTMGQTIDIRQQVTHHGRFGIELLGINARHLKREDLDRALERAVAWIDDPAAAAKLPTLEAPVLKSKMKELKVTVVGPDGKPVPRGNIATIVKLDGKHAERSESLRGGAATLTVPRQPCSIWVSRATTENDEPLPFAPSKPIAVEADQEEVEVRLVAGHSIRGRVLAPDQGPAEGIEVEASPIWGSDDPDDHPWLVHAKARTDAEGRFEIIGLAKRRYELILTKNELSIHPSKPRVEAGAAPTEILLKTLATVTLTINAKDGTPVPGAVVVLRGRDSGYLTNTTTDEKGVATLKGVDPEARHTMDVSPGKDSGAVAELLRHDLKPVDQTIVLRPGWTLHGTVEDYGEPTKARVRRQQRNGSSSAQTRPDGTFTIYGLPEGPVTVIGLPLGNSLTRFTEFDWTTVPQTDKPVTLVLFKPSQTEPKKKQPKKRELEPAGGK